MSTLGGLGGQCRHIFHTRSVWAFSYHWCADAFTPNAREWERSHQKNMKNPLEGEWQSRGCGFPKRDNAETCPDTLLPAESEESGDVDHHVHHWSPWRYLEVSWIHSTGNWLVPKKERRCFSSLQGNRFATRPGAGYRAASNLGSWGAHFGENHEKSFGSQWINTCAVFYYLGVFWTCVWCMLGKIHWRRLKEICDWLKWRHSMWSCAKSTCLPSFGGSLMPKGFIYIYI